MTTMTTDYAPAAATGRRPLLRRLLGAAAVFDALGGAVCLVAAGPIGGWLSIPRAPVYGTGAAFALAAVAGAWTLRRDVSRVGGIVAANELFALWCLLVVLLDGPNAAGVVLLLLSVLSSAGTGAAELYLARRR